MGKGKAWANLSTSELGDRLASGSPPLILDVRTASEVVSRHIAGVVWIPLTEIPHRFREVDPSTEIVVVCGHGVRSAMVCWFLAGKGYRRLMNLTGGMAAWMGPVERGVPSRISDESNEPVDT